LPFFVKLLLNIYFLKAKLKIIRRLQSLSRDKFSFRFYTTTKILETDSQKPSYKFPKFNAAQKSGIIFKIQ